MGRGREVLATPESVRATAEQVERYEQYAWPWKELDPAVREKVLKRNYERLFDEARK